MIIMRHFELPRALRSEVDVFFRQIGKVLDSPVEEFPARSCIVANFSFFEKKAVLDCVLSVLIEDILGRADLVAFTLNDQKRLEQSREIADFGRFEIEVGRMFQMTEREFNEEQSKNRKSRRA